MQIYTERKKQYTADLVQIKKKYNIISLLRLAVVISVFISAYYRISTGQNIYSGSIVVLVIVFVVLMKQHSKLSWQKKLKTALVTINTNEISYLNREKISFENGVSFNDFNHPYAYDLDIFGEHSLFQNLNRTETYIGQQKLAQQLLTILPNEIILQNQEAVQELAAALDWRQDIMALAKVNKDNEAHYTTLINWSQTESKPFSKLVNGLSYIVPSLFFLSIIISQIFEISVLTEIASYIFVFNLILFGNQYKKIQDEIQKATDIHKIISQYSMIVQQIEKAEFKTIKLQNLQKKLLYKNENASKHIQKLAELFSRMDTISNVVITVLFNGTFLFHVHTLRSLIKWKKEHAQNIRQWLDVIGEIETLNSLANLSYNNPKFAFPSLNTDYTIQCKNLSHPLLNKEIRVGNDVLFQPQSFMILTGSNMSGKSTFLRSLGINMVLAGIGSAICADKADIHPMPILVSMRLSDSLSDSESYFFAEIKRLKLIMDELEHKRAFVLLDEILRGTNSDDKRSGTIEVVKKMIQKQVIGVIATHDIEVCLTTDEYPDDLINKCFEVEIINDELVFDYKLRDGICKNKSATFLMKKMGVI